MSVKIEKNTAKELVLYKKNNIQKMIEEILHRWRETSVEQFLNNAKTGHHKNAENDAIDLRQLLIEEEKLDKLLYQISGDN